ncbi:MAG: hypothetical protein BWY25_03215 [Chloroflexi bacterium ADurb.Bin222]|nr:MAG: hypothetical protein BWY25_03215 [Chloroflexi bacterium ADurb.Bin222]
MGLQHLVPPGIPFEKHRPREQHVGGFAPDKSRAQHARAEEEQVFQGEIASNQLLYPGVARHRHAQDFVANPVAFLRADVAAGFRREQRFGFDEGAAPDTEMMPRQAQVVPAAVGKHGGRRMAVGNGTQAFSRPGMQRVTAGRPLIFQLQRLHKQPVPVTAYVQQPVGGGDDGVHRILGMEVAQDGKACRSLRRP